MLDVEAENAREESLNAASLQAIGDGGRAFVLRDSDMPAGAAAAALFRV
jgi:hypothetical protein